MAIETPANDGNERTSSSARKILDCAQKGIPMAASETTESESQAHKFFYARCPVPTKCTVKLPRSTFSRKKDQQFENMQPTQATNDGLVACDTEITNSGKSIINPKFQSHEGMSKDEETHNMCVDRAAGAVCIDTMDRPSNMQTPSSASMDNGDCQPDGDKDLQHDHAQQSIESSSSLHPQKEINDERAILREQKYTDSLDNVFLYCRQAIQEQSDAFEAKLARVMEQLEAVESKSPTSVNASRGYTPMDYPSPSSIPSDGYPKTSTPEPISLSRDMIRSHTENVLDANNNRLPHYRPKSSAAHHAYSYSSPPVHPRARSLEHVDEAAKVQISRLQKQLKASQDECAFLRALLDERNNFRTKPQRRNTSSFFQQSQKQPQLQQRQYREYTSPDDRRKAEWHSRSSTPFKQTHVHSDPWSLQKRTSHVPDEPVKMQDGYVEFRSKVGDQVVLCRVKAPLTPSLYHSSDILSTPGVLPAAHHHKQHGPRKPGLNPHAREWVGASKTY